VRSEGDRRLEVRAPGFEALPGKTVDQVDRNERKSSVAGNLDAPPCLVGVVPAAEKGELAGVEGLDSEREELVPQVAPSPSALRRDVLWIRLKAEAGPSCD